MISRLARPSRYEGRSYPALGTDTGTCLISRSFQKVGGCLPLPAPATEGSVWTARGRQAFNGRGKRDNRPKESAVQFVFIMGQIRSFGSSLVFARASDDVKRRSAGFFSCQRECGAARCTESCTRVG